MSDLVSELQTLIATEWHRSIYGENAEPHSPLHSCPRALIASRIAERVASAFQQVAVAYLDPIGEVSAINDTKSSPPPWSTANGFSVAPVWLFVSDLKETP